MADMGNWNCAEAGHVVPQTGEGEKVCQECGAAVDATAPPEVEAPQPRTRLGLYTGMAFAILESDEEVTRLTNEAEDRDFITLTAQSEVEDPHEEPEIKAPPGFMILTATPKPVGFTPLYVRAGLVAWYSKILNP